MQPIGLPNGKSVTTDFLDELYCSPDWKPELTAEIFPRLLQFCYAPVTNIAKIAVSL